MNSSSSDEDITTKEKERVRKKKYRALLSKKDTEDNRLLDKERKATERSQMTDAELEERRRKDREKWVQFAVIRKCMKFLQNRPEIL